MSILPILTNFFEMIAALAALAVAYLMYREVRRNRKDDQPK